MSSSGLIYAGIVGAWAVYLVPVWLRREEQLNQAREKARYAAAIRTLAHTERFEKKVLAEESLAATGTDGAPGPRGRQQPATKTVAAKKTRAAKPVKTAPGRSPSAPSTPAAVPAAAPARKAVTARLPHQRKTQTARQAQAAARHRGVLLMRRRRVVAFLFTLATFGAAVAAVLGVAYVWAMLAPAALFSLYIVHIRRDERLRAKERYQRRQAALAAERRRDRQRLADQRAATRKTRAVAEPDTTVWRPSAPPEEYRRAANG